MRANKKTSKMFPGYNCKQCGFDTCIELEEAIKKKKHSNTCVYGGDTQYIISQPLQGVLDGLQADFELEPLRGDMSCRELILPLKFDYLPKIGDYIKYRPLGCPITHFAKIVTMEYGLPMIILVGPREAKEFKSVGYALVFGFEGMLGESNIKPKVGQTIKFIPSKCMMRKVHSGVVVQVEGNKVRIELIDLKAWEHAK